MQKMNDMLITIKQQWRILTLVNLYIFSLNDIVSIVTDLKLEVFVWLIIIHVYLIEILIYCSKI